MDEQDQGTSTATTSDALKTSLHYSIGKISEQVAKDKACEFSKDTVAVVAESAWHVLQLASMDLEAFSKHGKRSTVNVDDVKLLARRNEALHHLLCNKATEIGQNKLEKTEKGKKSVSPGCVEQEAGTSKKAKASARFTPSPVEEDGLGNYNDDSDW